MTRYHLLTITKLGPHFDQFAQGAIHRGILSRIGRLDPEMEMLKHLWNGTCPFKFLWHKETVGLRAFLEQPVNEDAAISIDTNIRDTVM